MKNKNHTILCIFTVIILAVFFSCKKDDKILPVIKLNGDSVVNISLNTPYVDKGATASDDNDGDITKSILVKNEVDVNKIGTYQVYYSVTDKAGNVAPTKIRIVNVSNSSGNKIGNWSAVDYIYYPVMDTTIYNTDITIDSTLNNKIYFSVFHDILPKNSKTYAIINGSDIEIPYQKIVITANSEEYQFQGYGTVNDTLISVSYTKGYKGVIYSCKVNFDR